jgi:hypothetical protein
MPIYDYRLYRRLDVPYNFLFDINHDNNVSPISGCCKTNYICDEGGFSVKLQEEIYKCAKTLFPSFFTVHQIREYFTVEIIQVLHECNINQRKKRHHKKYCDRPERPCDRPERPCDKYHHCQEYKFKMVYSSSDTSSDSSEEE